MRKDRLYALGSFALFVWICMTYFLFVHRPNAEAVRRRLGLQDIHDKNGGGSLSALSLSHRMDSFEHNLKKTVEANSELLQALREAVKESQDEKAAAAAAAAVVAARSDNERRNNHIAVRDVPPVKKKNVVIAILMFACNRVTVSKALDSLLQYRKDKHKFPIIVSQVHYYLFLFKRSLESL